VLSSGPYIALAALAVAVALAGVAYWMARRQARLEAGQRAIIGAHGEQDLVEHALELEDQVRNLREAVTILTDEVERYRHDLDAAFSNIAVVRFDAFRDSGGEQSASIALLDGYRSGVVLSVFAARDFARIYVKYLDHGVPDRELAPEEEEAVRRAVPKALPRGELSRAPVSSFPRDVRHAVEQVRQAAAQAAAAQTAAEVGDRASGGAGDVPWGAGGPGTGADRAAGGRGTAATRPPQPGAPLPPPSPPTGRDAAPAATQPAPGGAPAETPVERPAEPAGAPGGPPGSDQEAPPADRRTKTDADWLGGDDLDF
jgi:hypothetical protein